MFYIIFLSYSTLNCYHSKYIFIQLRKNFTCRFSSKGCDLKPHCTSIYMYQQVIFSNEMHAVCCVIIMVQKLIHTLTSNPYSSPAGTGNVFSTSLNNPQNIFIAENLLNISPQISNLITLVLYKIDFTIFQCSYRTDSKLVSNDQVSNL